ncbi:EAL domain-containing protein [Nitrospirota bacterium]
MASYLRLAADDKEGGKRIDRRGNKMTIDYLVDGMACKLLGAAPGRTDSTLNSILSRICPMAGIDFLCTSVSSNEKEASSVYLWHDKEAYPHGLDAKKVCLETLPWFKDRLAHLEAVHVPNVSEMSEDAGSERKLFELLPAKSLVLIPLGIHHRIEGVVIIGSPWAGRRWHNEHIRLFKRVGLIISGFLEKVMSSGHLGNIEPMMQAFLDASLDAVLCFDGNGAIITANNAACEMFGYSAMELASLKASMLLPEDPFIKDRKVYEALAGSWTRNSRGETHNAVGKHKNGSVIPLTLSLREVHGNESQIIVAVARENLGEDMKTRNTHPHAFIDTLTGMSNRPFFLDCLRRSFDRSKNDKDYSFAILILDIDRFKHINDGLGHFAGDKLLELIGRRLKYLTRPGDNVARLSGDEFAFILHYIREAKDATAVADRVIQEFKVPFRLKEQDIFISASIGIAISSEECEHFQYLLRDASNAMFAAKTKGKARHEVFHNDMYTQALTTLIMESDMHNALKNNAYHVYYQPIVSLSEGHVMGFEALIRWMHPDRGMVNPSEFIPLCEETGFITCIGEWVLSCACAQLKQWKDSGLADRFISVNCSSKQILQPGFPSMVKRMIVKNGISAHLLELEVTESIALSDNAFNVLKELRNIGVKITIDDFGTGYSSLSELSDYPLDTLKIDKSFVDKISQDSSSVEIILAIMSIAWKLNLRVIAEGVETAEQLEFFRSLNCDAVQGFIFSKPMPAEQTNSFVNAYDLPRAIEPIHGSALNHDGGLGLSI